MLRDPLDPPMRAPREVFSRSKARKNAPPQILEVFESLWRKIDETELLLNFYDLFHKKRKLPPRATLLNRFSPPDITSISQRANALTPYTYLKLKHELVEMRREQYTLKDEYAPPILTTPTFNYYENSPSTFDEGITVLPIGLPYDNLPLYAKIFNAERYPIPSDFSESELRALSSLLWSPAPHTPNSYFDFSNPDHLYKLYSIWDQLEDAALTAPLESTLKYFLRAASMYRTLAALDPVLNDIFELKLQKKSNQDITEIINPKYNKKYQPNYISTLYCKKCLAKIAAAAARHRLILENVFFPENFKECKDCGATLYVDEENFVRRHRSRDGFSSRCKRCEKIVRDRRKLNETR